MVKARIARALVILTMLLGITAGGLVVTAGTASAVSASCGGGRCTVYLSKAETRDLGSGRVVAPPASLPWQAKGAYYALAHGHRWFAQQYANRGWCSGFRVSIYPWETQGYFGYAC